MLIQKLQSDLIYDSGTVVIFGGDKDITVTSILGDTRVAGVVANADAYSANITVKGKSRLSVIGPVAKGDLLITSDSPGLARSLNQNQDLANSYTIDMANSVFAKSMEDSDDTDPRTIWAMIL